MDYFSITNQLVGLLWYLIPLAILIGILKSPWFKGVAGEFIVNLSAKLLLDKNEYRLIKNVTLPTDDGTTQIDHIIVSRYGIFVVKTKNMKGWIFGSQNQKTWTQKIYKKSYKFQNPLHQNYKHVKTLEQMLGLNDEQFYSVVVFIGDATLKTVLPNNVTTGAGYIKFINSKKRPVLTAEQVEEIVRTIETGRLEPSARTHKDHVMHVKSKVGKKQGRGAVKSG